MHQTRKGKRGAKVLLYKLLQPNDHVVRILPFPAMISLLVSCEILILSIYFIAYLVFVSTQVIPRNFHFKISILSLIKAKVKNVKIILIFVSRNSAHTFHKPICRI